MGALRGLFNSSSAAWRLAEEKSILWTAYDVTAPDAMEVTDFPPSVGEKPLWLRPYSWSLWTSDVYRP